MKKILIAFLLFSSLAFAQDSYFGVDLTAVGFMIPGIQFGTKLAKNSDARLMAELWPENAVMLSSDILYTLNISDNSNKAYLGAGLDVILTPTNAGELFGEHFTAGIEFLLEEAGVYFEFQPTMIYYIPIIKIKAGLNLHF